MIIDPLYSVAGLLVGLLVGLTGVGGGSLMTPLLVLLFGFHPATAVGTDLLYASATKTVGTAVHGWRGTVEWKVVRRLAMGSIPATAITLFALSQLHWDTKNVGHVISFVLGAVLILSAMVTLFRARIVAYMTSRLHEKDDRRLAIHTAILGVTLGVLVSLTSVGAGAIGMTALLILYPQLPINKLVGSDIAHAVPLTLVAGIGHWIMGSVDGELLVALLIGSIPGVIIGSLISAHVRESVLRPILALVLIIVGGKLLFGS